ncbi:hypothetical protein D3C84_1046040 [compost metagenome]
MRRERCHDLMASRFREHHLNFRNMLVLVHFVSFEILIQLGVMRAKACTASCTGYACFCIDNNRRRIDPARLHGRNKAKQRRSDETARIRNK